MSKNLVIVESPSKSKTIEKYLGKGKKVSEWLESQGEEEDFVVEYLVKDKNKGWTKLCKTLKLIVLVMIVFFGYLSNFDGFILALF